MRLLCAVGGRYAGRGLRDSRRWGGCAGALRSALVARMGRRCARGALMSRRVAVCEKGGLKARDIVVERCGDHAVA